MKFHTVRWVSLLALLTAFVPLVFGDISPGPGYKRVSTSIVLETNEEITDYRFFVTSGDIAREIYLKKGEKTRVDSIGGGSRYRGGTVVAIPSKSLESYGATPDAFKLREMQEAIAKGGMTGRIDLIRHQFVSDVRDSEAKDVMDSAYRIERTKTGVTAVPLMVKKEDKPKESGLSSGITDIGKNTTPFGTATIVGGILMTLSIVALGLWLMSERVNKRV